mmetsp:Transcript_21746/g.31121  ORF Transcript_21746/g.31121 Transcript_21746/m.31121 type:complete len:205 (-) Transcript_21746:45-659(-)
MANHPLHDSCSQKIVLLHRQSCLLRPYFRCPHHLLVKFSSEQKCRCQEEVTSLPHGQDRVPQSSVHSYILPLNKYYYFVFVSPVPCNFFLPSLPPSRERMHEMLPVYFFLGRGSNELDIASPVPSSMRFAEDDNDEVEATAATSAAEEEADILPEADDSNNFSFSSSCAATIRRAAAMLGSLSLGISTTIVLGMVIVAVIFSTA